MILNIILSIIVILLIALIIFLAIKLDKYKKDLNWKITDLAVANNNLKYQEDTNKFLNNQIDELNKKLKNSNQSITKNIEIKKTIIPTVELCTKHCYLRMNNEGELIKPMLIKELQESIIPYITFQEEMQFDPARSAIRATIIVGNTNG